MRYSVVVLTAALVGAATIQPGLPEQLRALVYDRVDPAGASYPQMIDPPLWSDTQHLLKGESHARAIAILDAILADPVRETDRDLRQRAILQHELWMLFDWTLKNDDPPTHDARIALRKRLAAAIRHVAMTEKQIASLAGNLQKSDAPDLSQPEWVSVGNNGSLPIAVTHARSFGGRSAFGVFIHHPDGAPAAVTYLEKLATVKFPLPRNDAGNTFIAPGVVPDFPVGTRLALLRRMLLIDREGQLRASPIVQSVQTRTFLKIEPAVKPEHVRMEEFVLDRAAYIEGKASLRALRADEASPNVFLSHEIDPFEVKQRRPKVTYTPPQPTLATCIACHRDPGATSMNSYTGFFSTRTPKSDIAALSFEREIEVTRGWKESQASWGVLRGYFEASR